MDQLIPDYGKDEDFYYRSSHSPALRGTVKTIMDEILTSTNHSIDDHSRDISTLTDGLFNLSEEQTNLQAAADRRVDEVESLFVAMRTRFEELLDEWGVARRRMHIRRRSAVAELYGTPGPATLFLRYHNHPMHEEGCMTEDPVQVESMDLREPLTCSRAETMAGVNIPLDEQEEVRKDAECESVDDAGRGQASLIGEESLEHTGGGYLGRRCSVLSREHYAQTLETITADLTQEDADRSPADLHSGLEGDTSKKHSPKTWAQELKDHDISFVLGTEQDTDNSDNLSVMDGMDNSPIAVYTRQCEEEFRGHKAENEGSYSDNDNLDSPLVTSEKLDFRSEPERGIIEAAEHKDYSRESQDTSDGTVRLNPELGDLKDFSADAPGTTETSSEAKLPRIDLPSHSPSVQRLDAEDQGPWETIWTCLLLPFAPAPAIHPWASVSQHNVTPTGACVRAG
ncbi:hypothetical protein B0H15DRAFT_806796 [Mycena belliarum]|uniref:Uncharacterized protein n=1 Tax=Mycena belliarum TaxID=1033014 RepID=A0AAD6XIK4_9AGAR|nr:hypothetical protein B0H15DRAFT_806796 [Mycena belliae]